MYFYRIFLAIISLGMSAFLASGILALPRVPGFDEMLIIKGSVLTALSFLFFFSFISVTNSSWMIQEYDLLKPLVALPVDEAALRNSILASTLIDCVWMAIIPISVGATLAVKFTALLPLAAILLYTLSTILLSLGLGFHAGSIVGLRKYGGAGIIAKTMRVLHMVLLLIVFLSFRIVYYLSSAIKAILGPLGTLAESLWFVYPFSAAEGTTAGMEGLGLGALAGLLPALLYPILFYAIYVRGFKRFWRSLAHPVFITLEKSSFVGQITAPSRTLLNPVAGIAFKDLKLATREPRIIYMAVFPIFELLYLLYMLYRAPTGDLTRLIAPFAVIGSAFYAPLASYMFLKGEGKSARVLLSNPVSRRDLAIGKSLAPTIIMAVYMIPIGAVLAWMVSVEHTIALATALLTGFSSSAFAMRTYASHVLKTGDVAAIPSGTQIKAFVSYSIFTAIPILVGWFSYSTSRGNLVYALLLSLLSSELLFAIALVSLFVLS